MGLRMSYSLDPPRGGIGTWRLVGNIYPSSIGTGTPERVEVEGPDSETIYRKIETDYGVKMTEMANVGSRLL